MTQEQFEKYQEATFDSFCKTVIKNSARNLYREKMRRLAREVSFSSLSPKELASLSTSDSYTLDAVDFSVQGEAVTIRDPSLAAALRYLPPRARNVILLFYFLDRTEEQIPKYMNMSQSSVNARRRRTLDLLKATLEDINGQAGL